MIPGLCACNWSHKTGSNNKKQHFPLKKSWKAKLSNWHQWPPTAPLHAAALSTSPTTFQTPPTSASWIPPSATESSRPAPLWPLRRSFASLGSWLNWASTSFSRAFPLPLRTTSWPSKSSLRRSATPSITTDTFPSLRPSAGTTIKIIFNYEFRNIIYKFINNKKILII